MLSGVGETREVTTSSAHMKLACYGWVIKDAGSVASANYVVLQELLRRGIEVHLFANPSHIPYPDGLDHDHFRYFEVMPPRFVGNLPAPLYWLLYPYVSTAWRLACQPAAEKQHRKSPYDALLSLGTPPVFTLGSIPTIVWLQGPLHTELEAIKRLKSQIVSLNGRVFYLSLLAYYSYRNRFEQRILASCDQLICGSEWARKAIISRGFPAREVHALPYPIDLDFFRPRNDPDLDWERPVLLHLGRLDPRKRLDLLLEAFPLVLQAFPHARLRVVGHRGYAPNQLSLIERSSQRSQIEYRARIEREHVPSLLRESTVVVQPSENENFGSTVAEALACGTPVVVGPSNGTAEYIDANSRVFERYAPDSLATAIVRTIEFHRDHANVVRRSTRASADLWFSASCVVDRLLEIIERSVDERRLRFESIRHYG